MKRRLSLKFLIVYFLISLCGFILIATLGSNILNRNVQNTYIEQMRKSCNLVLSTYRAQPSGNIVELDFLKPQLSTISEFQNCDVWIVDQNAHILEEVSTLQNAPESISAFDPSKGIDGYYMIGDFYGIYSKPVITVYTALTRSFQIQGYVICSSPVSIIAEKKESFLYIAYITWLMTIVLGLFFLLLFHLAVINPLNKIITTAKNYASGNLNFESDVHSHDEMGYLSDTLSFMAQKLNNIGEDQHRFIANISHDFRSPLTSIKGYIEAILDGTIPVELQDKYLEIILNETNRLTNLTNSILTLNTFDASGVILDRSRFDINAVIRSILETFEKRCKDRKIYFELSLSAKQQYVYADMGKIQQVLYNLIDNAIKFSNPDSSIDITVTLHYEKTFISIKDHGTGIPRQDLPKIWERFYKTDTSRGKDKKGTGLGLSIVKEIIQAHNENIDVISTPDAGTEFTFSLPIG